MANLVYADSFGVLYDFVPHMYEERGFHFYSISTAGGKTCLCRIKVTYIAAEAESSPALGQSMENTPSANQGSMVMEIVIGSDMLIAF